MVGLQAACLKFDLAAVEFISKPHLIESRWVELGSNKPSLLDFWLLKDFECIVVDKVYNTVYIFASEDIVNCWKSDFSVQGGKANRQDRSMWGYLSRQNVCPGLSSTS